MEQRRPRLWKKEGQDCGTKKAKTVEQRKLRLWKRDG